MTGSGQEGAEAVPQGAPSPTAGQADPEVGGAAGMDEGDPIGFTADVGGEPGMTDDPEEARDASSGGEAGRHGTSGH